MLLIGEHCEIIEKNVLGCVIKEPKEWSALFFSNITINHFYSSLGKQLFDVINKLHSEGKIPDTITVNSKIQDNTELMVYFYECVDYEGLDVGNFETYIAQLTEFKLRRDIQHIGLVIDNADFDDIPTLLATLNNQFQTLQPVEKTNKAKQYEQILNEYADLKKHGCDMDSGWPSFDKLTNGFKRKRLYVFGGFPGVGKTGLATYLAQRIVFDKGKKILFFSLEMSAFEMLGRLASVIGEVPSSKIQDMRYMSDEDFIRLKNTCAKIYESNFILEDDNWTVPQMVAKIKDEKPDFVVIDHMQSVPLVINKNEMPHEAITRTCKYLRDVSKRENFCLLILSQMKADGSNFKNCAGINEAADLSVVIKRPEGKEEKSEFGGIILPEQEGMLKLEIRKNRNGRLGFVPLVFNHRTLRFSEYLDREGV